MLESKFSVKPLRSYYDDKYFVLNHEVFQATATLSRKKNLASVVARESSVASVHNDVRSILVLIGLCMIHLMNHTEAYQSSLK